MARPPTPPPPPPPPADRERGQLKREEGVKKGGEINSDKGSPAKRGRERTGGGTVWRTNYSRCLSVFFELTNMQLFRRYVTLCSGSL